jgi:prophage regulatory protein
MACGDSKSTRTSCYLAKTHMVILGSTAIPLQRPMESAMPLENVPRPKFLRLSEVVSRVGISRSAIYVWIAADKFPAQVKLGTRTVWVEAEVEAWVLQRIADDRNIKRGEG